ncbi:MFS transporter [Acinetobacter indicus]|uniref:MFS transporter n=1 Tax=Acinetobacter indicus TaxID=756892 RepID=UPI0014442451|nr:MFS transporter [Acinetobacter indicus]
MSNTASQPLWNKPFLLCFSNNLFLFIFYFAQTTILPIYILNELNGSLAQAGLAMTLFMVSSILVRPFSGLIIEKLGRKKTLFLSESMFCLLSFAYIFADNLTLLLIIRFIQGIWFSILTTVTVPIANDFIPEQRKGEGMGYFVMSVNLGIVLGPLLGISLIQTWSYSIIATVLAVIISLGFAFCFMIPLREPEKTDTAATVRRKLSLHDFMEKKALTVSVMAMLVAFSYASIMSFISTYAEEKDLLSYTSIFFIVFAISMMSLRPITGKIYDRYGPRYVIYPSILMFAAGLALLSQMQGVVSFMVSAIFIGMGFGTLQPCLQTLAIQRAPKSRIGHATSTFFTCYDIGIALGSLLVGLLISWQGYSITYLVCAGVVLSSLLFYKFVVNHPATT